MYHLCRWPQHLLVLNVFVLILLSHWYLVEFRNKAYATINGYFDTRFIREHAKSEGNYNKP